MRPCNSWRGATELLDRLPADSDNLVVRALELFRERSGCQRGAHVELVKRIPIAAGLGGGSSDAAAALKLANRALGHRLGSGKVGRVWPRSWGATCPSS